MEKKIKLLQIGAENWEQNLSLKVKEQIEWNFAQIDQNIKNTAEIFRKKLKKKTFDVIICSDTLDNNVILMFADLVEPYALIIDQNFKQSIDQNILIKKCPLFMDFINKEKVIDEISQSFFAGQYGDKMAINTIDVNQNFTGETAFEGKHRLVLSGNFDKLDGNPLLNWQYNIFLHERNLKLWLEFELLGEVNLEMIITALMPNTDQELRTWKYNEQQIKQGIQIERQDNFTYLLVALTVTGQGTLKVGNLHQRHSRKEYGEYLLGGKKIYSEKDNEELFYYFHPGDLKPPLNVYFSGFRTAEGFEGFYMMKQLGAPFLLIADPRLEGGAFYLADDELEVALIKVIRAHLERLGFTTKQLILSGLSMGTFGALYYSAFLEPHTVILGKPLVNLGDMAKKEKIIRPAGFPTSLDLLNANTGALDDTSVNKLNQKFWEIFNQADFKATQFVMSYMLNDDYDDKAYFDILENLSDVATATVIGKGIPGRHNDNSQAVNQWFFNHYIRILKENFERKNNG